jgi:hypothetical protein
MAARTIIQPVTLNSVVGGTFPTAPATGIDAAAVGTTFATAWAGAATGVQFSNNGLLWLWYYNGATACTASYLVGDKAAGQPVLWSTVQVVLNTTGYGWLGPWSPAAYNQQDAAIHTASPGGVIGAAGVGLTCIDFSATGTLAVRLMQLVPVTP